MPPAIRTAAVKAKVSARPTLHNLNSRSFRGCGFRLILMTPKTWFGDSRRARSQTLESIT